MTTLVVPLAKVEQRARMFVSPETEKRHVPVAVVELAATVELGG
jgi:hypothetical protein